MNIYQHNGYKDREEYLEALAETEGVPLYKVEALAALLGEDEDFDGLVSMIKDIAGGF